MAISEAYHVVIPLGFVGCMACILTKKTSLYAENPAKLREHFHIARFAIGIDTHLIFDGRFFLCYINFCLKLDVQLEDALKMFELVISFIRLNILYF